MSTASGVPQHHPDAVSPGYTKYDIIACIFTFLAASCVALRFYHRSRSNDYKWDDWAVLVSLIFTIGVLIGTLLISAPSIAGAGYQITTYTIPELNTYFKIALASDVLYNFSVAASKASIVLFYHRIFSVDQKFLLFMRIVGFLIMGNCLTAALGLIFSDNPVQAQWNVGMPHTSINERAFWTCMAVINILLDTMILAVPLVKLWSLHLSTQRKLLISSLFVLGAFTIVTSILRIVYLLVVDIDDITYTLTEAGIWTNVEMNLSIVCACTPVIYGFLHRRQKDRSISKEESGWVPGKISETLVTIGSAPSKFDHSFKGNQSGISVQETISHTGAEMDGETHSLVPILPIHIRREYEVR